MCSRTNTQYSATKGDEDGNDQGNGDGDVHNDDHGNGDGDDVQPLS